MEKTHQLIRKRAEPKHFETYQIITFKNKQVNQSCNVKKLT